MEENISHNTAIDTVESNIENEKALEDFLMDIDCLDELEKWTNKLNFFDITSASGVEIRHSNFLSWLMNPKGKHGLGDYFIKKILFNAARLYGHDKTPISIADIDAADLSDLIVLREESNIDILAISDKSKLVLTIENKIHSQEHDKQLERYYEEVCRRYPNYRRFFIYLTLDGERPSMAEWYPMSHDFIRNLVKSVLDNRDLTERCRIYLEDYSNTLAGELMNDDELKQTCIKIYNSHKPAIDLIIANLPNAQTLIYDRCKELLIEKQKEGKVKMMTSTRKVLRFTTPRIRAKAGQIGIDPLVPEKDILFFEIDSSPSNNRYMTFYIGPGEAKDRKAWFDYLKDKAMDRAQKRDMTDSWTGIQIKRIKMDESDDGYVEKFVSLVSDYLEYLPKLEKIIESAPIYNEEQM